MPPDDNQEEFIHRPNSKGSNYDLIFTMELLKLFYEPQLRAFFETSCLPKVRAYLKKRNITLFRPSDEDYVASIKACCNCIHSIIKEDDLADEEDVVFPFLQETEENTWLRDSLLSNLIILAPDDLSYDSYITAYASSSYLTKNEGDLIIDYYTETKVRVPLAKVIQEITGREFREDEISDASENFLRYALSSPQARKKRRRYDFLTLLLPEICAHSPETLQYHWCNLVRLHQESASDRDAKTQLHHLATELFSTCDMKALLTLLRTEDTPSPRPERTKAYHFSRRTPTINRKRSISEDFEKLPLQLFAIRIRKRILNSLCEKDELVMQSVETHAIRFAIFRQLDCLQGVELTLTQQYYCICNLLVIGATYILPPNLLELFKSQLLSSPAALLAEGRDFARIFETYGPKMYTLHPSCHETLMHVQKTLRIHHQVMGAPEHAEP